MKTLLCRWSATAFAIGLFGLLLSGCVVPGAGYGYDNGGYYQPYGVNYGGWGSGYQVAPYYRGGAYYPATGGYQAAPYYRGGAYYPATSGYQAAPYYRGGNYFPVTIPGYYRGY
jgi:hypothetical protein